MKAFLQGLLWTIHTIFFFWQELLKNGKETRENALEQKKGIHNLSNSMSIDKSIFLLKWNFAPNVRILMSIDVR
jgi:hypothetical protein